MHWFSPVYLATLHPMQHGQQHEKQPKKETQGSFSYYLIESFRFLTAAKRLAFA